MENDEFEAKYEKLTRWLKCELLELLVEFDRLNEKAEEKYNEQDMQSIRDTLQRLGHLLELQSAKLENLRQELESEN